MNGNLNTALLMLDDMSEALTGVKSAKPHIVAIKSAVLDEVKRQQDNESKLDSAYNLLETMRDDGFNFQHYEKQVSEFLGIDSP